MKHIKTFLLFVLTLIIAGTTWAQVPQNMTYQAVVRNADGQPVALAEVGVRFSLLQGSEIGSAVWTRQGTVRTDAAGLFSYVMTDLNTIDWTDGPYYLRSEIDPDGGSNYIIATVQQLLSVPYALRAAVADSVVGGSSSAHFTESDPVFSAWDKDYNSLTNRPTAVSAFTNDAGYLTSYTESQSLADVATLGNSVGTQIKSLSDPTDPADAVNLQTLNAAISALVSRFDSVASAQARLIDSLRSRVALLQPGTLTGVDVVSACDRYTWIDGRTYTASDTTTRHLISTPSGADSVVTLHLTIYHSSHIYDTISATDSLVWNGLTYFNSGDYRHLFTDRHGCDSMVHLHLVIRTATPITSDTTVRACDEYTWEGDTYTASGDYVHRYPLPTGGDSVVTLHLTINHSSRTDTTITTTDSLYWNGHVLLNAGFYLDTLTNSYGCDSLVALRLIIVPPAAATSDTTVRACDEYTWEGDTYTTSGDYVHRYPLPTGGDSVVTLHLTINHSSRTDTTITTTDSLYWNGHVLLNAGFYLDTLTNSYGCDSLVALRLIIVPSSAAFDANGATRSTFSVDSVRTVKFSKGNLQFNAALDSHAVATGSTAPGTWRFAEHQWDTIGAANSNISSTYDGWVDLFGWGTSGWNSGADAWQPWSTSSSSADYCPGGVSTNNLTGAYANADWGVYNAISNGGNQPGQWRTLTKDEWEYLFNTRTASTLNGTANARYAKAKVNNVQGVILFPDAYTHPTGVAAPTGINVTDDTGWNGNDYSGADWTAMEAAGCVFLSAAGYRVGTGVVDAGTYGCYWSSTHYYSNAANDVYFYSTYLSASPSLTTASYSHRDYGHSVRLVQD